MKKMIGFTLFLACSESFAPTFDIESSSASSTGYDIDTSSSDDLISASSGTDVPSSSSEGYEEVCGNGILDPGEECEQGDPYKDFTCNSLCIRSRLIFMSSLKFKGSELGGIYNASEICKSLAKNVGLLHWENFESFLSNSITNARDRVEYKSKGYYITTYGNPVARNFEDLVSGNLLSLTRFDEYGDPTYSNRVWSGTDNFGFRVIKSTHCDDWTANPPGASGIVGDPFAFNLQWLYSVDNPQNCDQELSIYCIEAK